MRAEIDDIARVAHEVNSAYRAAIGETPSAPWDHAPAAERASAIAGVEAIAHGDVTTPEDAHVAWMRLKQAEGWTQGEVKDPVRKTHPDLIPYDDLSSEQKIKDTLFFAVVTAMLRP